MLLDDVAPPSPAAEEPPVPDVPLGAPLLPPDPPEVEPPVSKMPALALEKANCGTITYLQYR